MIKLPLHTFPPTSRNMLVALGLQRVANGLLYRDCQALSCELSTSVRSGSMSGIYVRCICACQEPYIHIYIPKTKIKS